MGFVEKIQNMTVSKKARKLLENGSLESLDILDYSKLRLSNAAMESHE